MALQEQQLAGLGAEVAEDRPAPVGRLRSQAARPVLFRVGAARPRVEAQARQAMVMAAHLPLERRALVAHP